MRFFRSLLILCALLSIFSAPSWAEQEGPQLQPLSVVANKSTLVVIDAPAATVFIANPEIADVQVVTPTRIMVMGKRIGETTLIISDDRGQILANRTVVVTTDMAELKRALYNIAPNDTITAAAVPNGVILSGSAKDNTTIEMARRIAMRYVPEKDGDIINNIKSTANNQIQIQVRFAEVSREVDKRFGINWENAINSGVFAFGFGIGPDYWDGSTVTRTNVGDTLNDALSMGYSEAGQSVNAMIDALAKNGLVTILAEPNLTAMSGETASFLAGGEFPVPVPQSSDTISIEWKEYGVSLAFTPTILSDGRINLHVRPEVSQLSSTGAVTLSNIEIPSLTTRRAETTVELGSGQSFAIAGLLNNYQTQAIDKFPFLGDLPVLGPLFRSTRFQNDESELVIIITPYIVKPTRQENLSLPTDGLKQPTDPEFLGQMRNTSDNKDARPLSGVPRAIEIEEIPLPKAVPSPMPIEPVEKISFPITDPIVKPAPKPTAPPLSAMPKKSVDSLRKAVPPPPPPRTTALKTGKSKPPVKEKPLSELIQQKTPPAQTFDGGGFIME